MTPAATKRPARSTRCPTCHGPGPTPYWPMNWLALALPRLWSEAGKPAAWSVGCLVLLAAKLIAAQPVPWWVIAGVFFFPALISIAVSATLALGPLLMLGIESWLARQAKPEEETDE